MEDETKSASKDLRSYIRSLSPHKTFDLKSQEIISTNFYPNEYNLKYLRKILPEMDGVQSVRPDLPIITNEEILDWCQQSMNRKLQGIPLTKPFMMTKSMHEKLRDIQKQVKNPQTSASIEKEFMTVTEVQTILNRKALPVRQLQPRTFENGVPVTYPKETEKKEGRPRGKSARAVTIFHPDRGKTENLLVFKPDEPVSIYKQDSGFARQVFEMGKKKIKYFQNLAFSSVFLGKVIESQKNVFFNVPSEFKTPLIEQKDVPDLPSALEVYLAPWKRAFPDEVLVYAKKVKQENWLAASLALKEYLKTNQSSVEAIYLLALCLERLNCYKLGRKWLVEAVKIEFDNLDFFFGLALLSFKLNEIGNCIYFCVKIIESSPGAELARFYFLLSCSYRVLNDISQCNKFYQVFLDTTDVKNSIISTLLSNEWDEQLKSLQHWIQLRSDIPFFRRFKSKQVKKLCANKLKKIEAFHVFFLQKNYSYVVLKGHLKIRDHLQNCSVPKTTWKVQTGQYINYFSHGIFYDNLHYWTTSDTSSCFLLEIPAENFSSISRETRTNKEVVNMHILQSFSLFKDFSLETLEAIVLESMKIKKCHKTQIVRKRILDRKQEKKVIFGIILAGICDLKREDGFDICYLSRGDFFGEEFLFPDIVGLASLGNIIVKSENLEVGFIPPQDLLRLPDYELQKLQKSIKENLHIKRSVSKATSSFGFHARWHSSDL